MMQNKVLGLIAGNGNFPILFAKNAKARKIRVVAAAIKGDTSIFLKGFVDELAWIGPGELQKLFDYFKKENVAEVIMAGQVNPENLFNEKLTTDSTFQKLFAALKDRKADSIFAAIADKLKEHGMTLLDSTLFLKEYLAPKGTLTRRAPTLVELGDVEFGKDIARAMGRLDVGQTVVIKEKAIVAIEAMEGTNQTILRAGRIAKKGCVVIKLSKPQQDNRFDVPVVGPVTIQTMIKAKAGCLAVEAGKTIILDRDKVVRMADKAKICILATE